MNSTHRDIKGSTFDNIVNMLCTPITWSLIADTLGVSVKVASAPSRKGILSICGDIKLGVHCKYRIGDVEFDVNQDTCVVGNITTGASARVKVLHSLGKTPLAISVVIINDRYKH